jgi:elongation factor G
MSTPRPILFAAVAPKNDSDGALLRKVVEEIARIDPSLTRTDPVSGEATLCGQSEQHLEAIRAMILADYQIATNIGDPQVIYLETIRKASDGEGKYIRQTGGTGNYGHVKIRIEPHEPGAGSVFVSEIRGGVVPEQYLRPIEEGIRQAALGGILAGCEVIDFKVALYDGSYHEVDSNEMAFRIAGSLAFKEAARMANPVVLEPWMTVEVTAPEEQISIVIRDLSARRGRLEDVAPAAGWHVIKAVVPLAKMLGYAEDLRRLTRARASHTIQFARYEPTRFPFDADADSAGAAVLNPRGPRPRTDAAAADPEWDWT